MPHRTPIFTRTYMSICHVISLSRENAQQKYLIIGIQHETCHMQNGCCTILAKYGIFSLLHTYIYLTGTSHCIVYIKLHITHLTIIFKVVTQLPVPNTNFLIIFCQYMSCSGILVYNIAKQTLMNFV